MPELNNSIKEDSARNTALAAVILVVLVTIGSFIHLGVLTHNKIKEESSRSELQEGVKTYEEENGAQWDAGIAP